MFNAFSAEPRSLIVHRFASDRSGATAVIFAVALPALALIVGAAADYADYSRIRTRLQQATDDAAVAGTTALTQGRTADEAKTIAMELLSANAKIPASQVNPSAAVSKENDTATVVARASYTYSSFFTKVTGVSGVTMTPSATAQAYIGASKMTSASAGSIYGGSGSVYGDPEITYADGRSGFIDCKEGNWYNALSDAGLQVNFSCYPGGGAAYYGGYWMLIDKVTVRVGSHIISYSAPWHSCSLPSGCHYSSEWPAEITVDGRRYVPPTRTYPTYTRDAVPEDLILQDGAIKISVKPMWDASINQSATGMYSFQYLKIVNANYTVKIGSVNYSGYMGFDAVNAGLCGIPGGAWGRSMGGQYVGGTAGSSISSAATLGSYQMLGPQATSPEFYWNTSCDKAVARSTTPHLIQ